MTDWSKALEVFGSGILGVFLVMVVLQVVTQLSIKAIDLLENWKKSEKEEKCPKPQSQPAAVKNRG